jgi:hypothetical protein
MYLARHHPDAMDRIRMSDNRYLACSNIAPPSPDTLPRRMVAFAFIHADACEMVAQRDGVSVTQLLERAFPGAGGLWEEITGA